MKYILELLGSSQPYPSRYNAIAALDAYLYHRPGQPIAAVYIDRDANRRALLAIGHDYGKGKGSGTYRRYTIIGDADASQTVNNYNWASQIKLSRISYKRLLDDYGENVTPGHRRFGYLGTVYDSWHTNPSSASDIDCVPNGASVQAAFEHILKGDFGSDSDNYLRLNITANPTQITLPGTGESGVQYTVTVSAEYSGNLTDASLTANYGQGGGASFMPSISGPSHTWTADYIIDSSFASVMGSLNSYAIRYTASATVEGLETVTATAVVTVVRPEVVPPDPTATYTVTYTPLAVSGEDVSEQKTGEWTAWTLRSTSPWEPPTGYYLDGWSTDSTGSEDQRVTSFIPNDFAGTTDNTIRVYPIWKLEDVEPKVLVITAPSQSHTYDATLHYYDHTKIKVSCGGQELPFSWTQDGTSWTGTGDGFTVAFVGNDIPSQENVGTDSNSVSVANTDDRYETGSGSSAQATVTVTPKAASVTTKINGKSSETLYTGSAVPSDLSAAFSNFVGGQESAFGTIGEHGVWVPTLNMNTAGTYTLQFDYSSVSQDILSNYSITTNWATLTLEEEPLRVTFTTTGYTNEPAVHQSDLASTSFIHKTATSNGLSGNVNDWWIFVSDRRSASQYTTYIYSNKNIGNFSIMRWDSASNIWRDMSSQLSKFTVDSSAKTITFKYYNEDDELWEVETSLYAIKFN